jgi:hypothetical protein
MVRKQFFFEKKNKKTFICLVRAVPHRAPEVAKVFSVFFSKENCCVIGVSHG